MAFVKLQRSQAVLDLIEKDIQVFSLLTIIAQRADRETGEAFLGDWRRMGATSEATYRRTKKRAEATGLATFKATNKGTIARLTNTSIYDINMLVADEQTDEQTDEQRPKKATNKPTTNKKYQEVFIQEVSRRGAAEPLVHEWLALRRRKKSPNSETALTRQLTNIDHLITKGYPADSIVRVCAENGWIGVSLEPYFTRALDALRGPRDAIERITDDSWAAGYQPDIPNSPPALPGISQGLERGGGQDGEADVAAAPGRLLVAGSR